MQIAKKPGLTRDTIKYIAIFTMLLNHIANVLLPENTILWEVLVDIGYFTAITMCYFLVEGFYYTHSRRKYGERLLIFAGISQVPYMMAFDFSQLNMIFTLFICFMILVIQDKMMVSKWRIPLTLILLVCPFIRTGRSWHLFLQSGSMQHGETGRKWFRLMESEQCFLLRLITRLMPKLCRLHRHCFMHCFQQLES